MLHKLSGLLHGTVQKTGLLSELPAGLSAPADTLTDAVLLIRILYSGDKQTGGEVLRLHCSVIL